MMCTKKYQRLLILISVLALILASCSVFQGDHKTTQSIPTIKIKPESGGMNTLINITGSGFPVDSKIGAYFGPANIGIGPTVYGEDIADKNGNISIGFTLPGQWQDGTQITEKDLLMLVGLSDGSLQAAAKFNYQYQANDQAPPVVWLNPINGTPGTKIEFNGIGFPPNTNLALRLGAPNSGLSTENLTTVQTDASGKVKTTFTIPTKLPGTNEDVTQKGLVVVVLEPTQGAVLSIPVYLNITLDNFVSQSGFPDTPAVCNAHLIDSPNPTGVAISNFLSLHVDPSMESDTIATLQRCQVLALVGRDADGTWLQVSLPGGYGGWVLANFIQMNVAVNILQIANNNQTANSTPIPLGQKSSSGVWVTLKQDMVHTVIRGLPADSNFSVKMGAQTKTANLGVATGKTDATGAATVDFKVPDKWEDGSARTQTALSLVISTDSGATKTTTFDYHP